MIRDVVRAACVVAVLAVACSLIVETRLRLAAIDVAHRQAVAAAMPAVPTGAAACGLAPAEPAGPLARLGRATVGLADAALGVVR